MKNLLTLGTRAAAFRSLLDSLRVGCYGVAADLMAVRDMMYEIPGRLFDARHGVDTCGLVQIPDLVIPETLRAQAGRYQPTKITVFRDLIGRLPLDDPERFAFVDFGCGKGRCLLLAAEAGFGKVIGVELSEPLGDAARSNAGKFMSGRYASKIDIQCTDAASAALPDQPSIYFFYNPFGERAMSATMRRIEHQLDKTGHEAYVVYVNPMHRSAVGQGSFRLIESGTRRSEDWTIWHRPVTKPSTAISRAS